MRFAKKSAKGLTREIYAGPFDFSHRAIKTLAEQKILFGLLRNLYSSITKPHRVTGS